MRSLKGEIDEVKSDLEDLNDQHDDVNNKVLTTTFHRVACKSNSVHYQKEFNPYLTLFHN